jgi:apolipoprotein N-acyltransferase
MLRSERLMMGDPVPLAPPVPLWARFPWRQLAAIFSGLILASAFPPFGSWQGAWFGLVPLLLAVLCTALAGPGPETADRKNTPVLSKRAVLRQSFLLGGLAGAVFWLITLSWLLRLFETSPAPAVLIVLGWLLLAGYCALYMGAFTMTFAWVVGLIGVGKLWRTLLLTVGIPVLWVGFEYGRSVLFGGFPWNLLGVSQYKAPALIQIAAWVGVPGVSAMMALLNAGVVFTVLRYLPGHREEHYRPHIELFLGLMVTAFCFRFGYVAMREYQPPTGQLVVTAVQPAIPQIKKWTDEQVDRIHATLRNMTEAAVTGSPKPDLVVWPETATPFCVTAEGASQDLVRDLCRHGVPILVGSMDVVQTNDTVQCFNSSFLFDKTGRVVARYDKQHLVPFGEYIPFSGLIPLLARLAPMGWNCSAGNEPTIFRIGNPVTPFACLICFEDVMAGLSRSAVRRGARLLINQTNDAWFDRSAGPEQHLSHCVFRSIENRVPSLRVANSGITCLIEPTGIIVAPTDNDFSRLPTPVLREWTVSIPSETMTLTPYSRYGDWRFAIPCAIVTALCLIGTLMAIRREPGSAGKEVERQHE